MISPLKVLTMTLLYFTGYYTYNKTLHVENKFIQTVCGMCKVKSESKVRLALVRANSSLLTQLPARII